MTQDEKKLRDKVLETLSHHQREGLISADTLAELVVSESDRGTVIIVGSLVEDALSDRIFSALETAFEPMSETLKKTLTKNGPLRDFGSALLMARALGLLEEDDAELLSIMKAVRNACAHCRQDISFATPALREAVALMFDQEAGEAVLKNSKTAWTAFMLVAARLLLILNDRKSGDELADFVSENALSARWLKKAHRSKLASWRGKPTYRPAPDLRPDPTDKGRRRLPSSSRP